MPRSSGHVTVVAVGKLRGRHWQAAQDDYARRVGRYIDYVLVEVKDVAGRSVPDAVAIAKEGEQLLQATPDGARRILLTPDAPVVTSTQLARKLQQGLQNFGHLAYLIGGPLGVSDSVVAAADERLPLSALTLPHELARIVLLEQLYRAFTIIYGEPYHK